MNDFSTYYRQQFQQDLSIFVEQIPIEGNKHYNKQDFCIQYFFLTPKYKYLDIIPAHNQVSFIISLFWIVLIDQIVYSDFRIEYSSFRKNTLFPKFIGNCTAPSLMSSQCGHNQNPRKILKVINDFEDMGNLLDCDRQIFIKDYSLKLRNTIYLGELLEKSKFSMLNEIKDIFKNHQPNINLD